MPLLLFFLLIGLNGLVQDQEYESGLIVLKDGRLISTRGDYEIFGDEIQFTHGNGQLMSLPLKKVDLEATDKRNKALRDDEKPIDKSTFGKNLKQYRPPPVIEGEVDGTQTGGNQPGLVIPASANKKDPPENEPIDFNIQDMENLEQQIEMVKERLDQASKPLMITFGVFLVLLLISVLISALTQLYLIYKGFVEGLLWGLTLFTTYFGPTTLMIVGVLMGSGYDFLFFVSSGLSLLHFILTLVFIIFHCQGSRFKILFFLYFLPIILAVLWVIVFAILLASAVTAVQ